MSAPLRRILPWGVLLLAFGCDAASAPQTQPPTAEACQAISTEYATAIAKARECPVGGANTCTKSVIGSFWCQCHVLVSGPTDNLTAIAARFDAAGCVGSCTGSCIMARAERCEADATSSTGGRCVAYDPDGGT